MSICGVQWGGGGLSLQRCQQPQIKKWDQTLLQKGIHILVSLILNLESLATLSLGSLLGKSGTLRLEMGTGGMMPLKILNP